MSTAEDFLFPPIEPYAHGRLTVDAPHNLYWEECGNPDGLPVIFVHGGPGSGCSPAHRRFFDPKVWRIILFDQRGAGRSTPFGDLTHNTTQALIADMEALRQARGVDKWVVFGGSWGSTLGLAYSETHPETCLGLIVRGIFLGEPDEIEWFMTGMKLFAPAAWRDFAEASGDPSGAHILADYTRLLNSDDPAVNMPAARAWSLYEARSSTLLYNAALEAEMSADNKALALARIEAHYFTYECFLETGALTEGARRLRDIPGVIIQGKYDLLCPIGAAQRLADAWPEAQFVIVPDAGHSAFEPGIARELVAAAKRLHATLSGGDKA